MLLLLEPLGFGTGRARYWQTDGATAYCSGSGFPAARSRSIECCLPKRDISKTPKHQTRNHHHELLRARTSTHGAGDLVDCCATGALAGTQLCRHLRICRRVGIDGRRSGQRPPLPIRARWRARDYRSARPAGPRARSTIASGRMNAGTTLSFDCRANEPKTRMRRRALVLRRQVMSLRGGSSPWSPNPLRRASVADGIVAAGSSIELTLPAPIDPQSAQGAIRVVRGCEQIKAHIQLDKRGRVVTVRLDESTVGSCELVVSELLSTKGERIVEHYRLPFAVVPITGKIPRDLRVEHAVRLFIGELNVVRLGPGETTRGGYVDVVKAVHRTKGSPVELAFDERGERVDIDKLLAELARSARRKVRTDTRDSVRAHRAGEGNRARGNRRVAPSSTFLRHPTTSPPIGARSNRPKARRRWPRRSARHPPVCAPSCSVRRSRF